MTTVRFNHMELTLPRGELGPSVRAEIDEFYGDLFGWKGMSVEVVGQDCHLLSVDEGQFILLTESDDPMSSPGYDHLGALMESGRRSTPFWRSAGAGRRRTTGFKSSSTTTSCIPTCSPSTPST